MRLPNFIFTSFCVTLLLISCGNSNGRGTDIQYEAIGSVIVDEVLESPSSNSRAANYDITPDDVIRTFMKHSKSALPIEMTEGMTITDIYLQGSYLFYQVECDDNIISVYELSNNADDAHSIMINYFYTMASNDDDFAIFISALIEKHMGICYRCVSDESGNYFDIKIKYSELANMF